MSYEDKTLTCRECSQPFAFTAGEQEFYASHGLVNEPGRCPECRSARRASQNGGYGAPRSAYPPREREMFTAVCSNCGQEAQVPFQPRAERPVYCLDCFQQVRPARPAYR